MPVKRHMERHEPAAFKEAAKHVRPPIWTMHLHVDGAWTLEGTYRHDTGFGLSVTIDRVLGDPVMPAQRREDADFPAEDDGWEDDWDCDIDKIAIEVERDDVDLWEGQTIADLAAEDLDHDQAGVFDLLTAVAKSGGQASALKACREIRQALVQLAAVVSDTIAIRREGPHCQGVHRSRVSD
ncbi:hypothetical protein [Glycomyces rhizosphaerae]|uniref:Uncharacterized protein n=1 Tax=Glycomyces rhizosphaerae TaxID=2054422 RepID=A0ABV7PUE3_9ACTN